MTAEQLHDALGLLPSDLIEEADALRHNPRKKPIPFRRLTALAAAFVLVLGCGLFAMKSKLLAIGRKEAAMDMAAPQAPMEESVLMQDVPVAAEEPGARNELLEEECDCAQSEVAEPTCGTPPVDVGSAQYCFADLGTEDRVYLAKSIAALEELGLEQDLYDGDWFADFDLLLIVLPGVTSQEGVDVSVGQGMDPYHWQIRFSKSLEERTDTAEALLILIPVQKGHIPRDAEFELIWQ